jgi:Homeobox KN domain
MAAPLGIEGVAVTRPNPTSRPRSELGLRKICTMVYSAGWGSHRGVVVVSGEHHPRSFGETILFWDRHVVFLFSHSSLLQQANKQDAVTMNLQGMPNKGRPQSPFAEPFLPTKTRTFSSSVALPSITVSPTPSASSCGDPKDDLEIMLLHEDFATLLRAAADLKEIREHIALHRDKPMMPDHDDDVDHQHPHQHHHHHRKKTTTTTNASHASSGDSCTDDNGDEASEEASSSMSTSNHNNNNHGVIVPVFQQIAKSAEHNNQVLTALDRMQKALVVNTNNNNNNNRSSSGHAGATTTPPYAKIPVGRYPVIDSVLEDAIAKLQHEYECCEVWIQKQFPTTQAGGISFQSSSSGKPERTTSLAVKYPKAQTDTLMEWMIENREDPFPSEDDLCMLAERTGLTTSQVVNWTTNVRKRNRKAVLDNKKKPHHFIDFLFLVQERENKKEESRRMYAWQHRKSPEQQSQSPPLPSSPPPLQQYPSASSSLLPLSDQGGVVAGSWPPSRHSPSHHPHHPHHHDHNDHNNSPSLPYHGQPLLQHPPHGHPQEQQQIQQQQQAPRYQSNHHYDRGSNNSLHRRSVAHLFNPLDRYISVPQQQHNNAMSPTRFYPPHYGGGGTPSDLAVPDGCISKRIFDEVEDLSASAKQYDDLMGNVKIEDWAPDVEGGGVGGGAATTAGTTDEYHHGPGQHRPYSYHPHQQHHHNNYGHPHPKQPPQPTQQLSPHHHHHHQLPQQVQQLPRHHHHHIMASASMDSNDNNDDDDEQRHRVSSLDFEIEHNGKEIDEFVTKNITTHDDML